MPGTYNLTLTIDPMSAMNNCANTASSISVVIAPCTTSLCTGMAEPGINAAVSATGSADATENSGSSGAVDCGSLASCIGACDPTMATINCKAPDGTNGNSIALMLDAQGNATGTVSYCGGICVWDVKGKRQ